MDANLVWKAKKSVSSDVVTVPLIGLAKKSCRGIDSNEKNFGHRR